YEVRASATRSEERRLSPPSKCRLRARLTRHLAVGTSKTALMHCFESRRERPMAARLFAEMVRQGEIVGAGARWRLPDPVAVRGKACAPVANVGRGAGDPPASCAPRALSSAVMAPVSCTRRGTPTGAAPRGRLSERG